MNMVGFSRPGYKFWVNNKGTFSIGFGRFYFYSNSEEQRSVLQVGKKTWIFIEAKPSSITFLLAVAGTFIHQSLRLEIATATPPTKRLDPYFNTNSDKINV